MADPAEAEPRPGGLALGCLGSVALVLALASILSSLTFSCEIDPLAGGDGGPAACGDEEGTALRCASARGQEEVVRDLLDEGADPNVVDASGETALLSAAAAGHLEVAAELVRAGADVNQGGSLSPSEVSERLGFVDGLTPDLSDERGNVPPLLIAAAEGDRDMVSALLLAGADPDLAAFGAYTPVYAAAALGYAPIVSTLVESGASPVPVAPNSDLTPAEAARVANHDEIADALDVATFIQ